MDPFELTGEAQVSSNGARRLRQGHLWVYASDVLREPENDQCVFARLLDAAGKFLGWAFHSRRSEIRLRFLTRETEPPDREFFRRRLRRSIARRRHRRGVGNAHRLVFGEADLLPSIIVDQFADFLSLQTLSSGAESVKQVLTELLLDELHPIGIMERNDVKARLLEGLDERRGVLAGEIPGEVEIIEHGVRYLANLASGQKTGHFLDQGDNRAAASLYAEGRALDCFTNTGGFALHFARRCSSVLAADSSAEALATARRNAALNGESQIEFREENVFDLLRELERAGEKFDIVCLDPPAFARNRKALPAAIGGYKEINLRAMRLLRPEGILVTSSCSYHVSEADFYGILQAAAQDSHRHAQVLERRGQSSDHPVLVGMPETHYLKCFILRIV